VKKFIALFLALILAVALLAGCTSADPNNPWENPDDPWAQEKTPKIETGSEEEEEEEETSAVLILNQL